MAAFGFFVGSLQAVVGAVEDATTVVRNSGPYRPAGWNQPAQTVLTVAQTTKTQGSDQTQPASPAAYVFDAILRIEHRKEVRKTERPVQSGSPTTDHVIRMPRRVTLEIGMSDAMDSYYPGNWTTAASKSVSAYQTLKQLQDNATLVNLHTRLDDYTNMLIVGIEAPDDHETAHGLRAFVALEEVFIATATAVSSAIKFGSSDISGEASARPQTSGVTGATVVQPAAVSPATVAQHSTKAISSAHNAVLNSGIIPKIVAAVPGAGSYSSNILNRVLLDIPELSKFK